MIQVETAQGGCWLFEKDMCAVKEGSLAHVERPVAAMVPDNVKAELLQRIRTFLMTDPS